MITEIVKGEEWSNTPGYMNLNVWWEGGYSAFENWPKADIDVLAVNFLLYDKKNLEILPTGVAPLPLFGSTFGLNTIRLDPGPSGLLRKAPIWLSKRLKRSSVVQLAKGFLRGLQGN